MKKKVAFLVIAVILIASFSFTGAGEHFVELIDKIVFSSPQLTSYTVPESGKGTGYFRHSYENLDDTEKQAYSLILQRIGEHPEKIRVPKLNGNQIKDVFLALSYDNPDILCLSYEYKLINRAGRYYFMPIYSESAELCNINTLKLEEVIRDIKKQTDTLRDDYEKEKFVHDYIIEKCKYTVDTSKAYANNAYGALVVGEAACEGYSRAFQLVLSRLDIDVRLITGKVIDDENGGTIGHMWNAVVIDDENYFVDLTWDDPISQEDIIGYAYFNTTGDMIKDTHIKIDQDIQCTATKYNYFVKENLYFTNTGDYFEIRVKSAVGYFYTQGRKSVDFRFSDFETYNKAKNKMINGNLLREAFELCGLIRKNSGFTINYSENPAALTLRLLLEA